MSKITVATFTLFDRVRAAASRPVYVVGDCYPGTDVPVAFVATGKGFRATYKTEAQAKRAAFLGMAKEGR